MVEHSVHMSGPCMRRPGTASGVEAHGMGMAGTLAYFTPYHFIYLG